MDLAEIEGRETAPFKIDVRKLKEWASRSATRSGTSCLRADLMPSSRSAARSHFDNVTGCTPKSCDLFESLARSAIPGYPDHVLLELLGIPASHDEHPSSQDFRPSQIRCPYPFSRP